MSLGKNCIQQHSWNEIKQEVLLINQSLYNVIEEICPSENIPFYIAKYNFGEHIGIKNHAYLPTDSGQLEKIENLNKNSQIYKDLNYGMHSIPLGMILDKHFEWHYFSDDGRIFPDCVQGAGAIFNMQIIFDEDKTIDNNVLSASAGALSSFLLPNIGCKRNHQRLERFYKISNPAPKNPYEHYLVFKELLDNANDRWQAKVLYFSKSFIDEVKNNDKWLKLKLYFSESLRKKLTQNTYDASCYDLFLTAKKVNRYRPTPFIIDTAKYIFNICMGAGLGVKPATDESYFPIETIQKIYNQCYGLEYTPTIMVPASLSDKNDTVYYPLQCPFAKINTFKTNVSNSTLTELETLRKVLLAYQEEFTEENGEAYGSLLYKISNETEFNFYHYQADSNEGIINSFFLKESDPRFQFSHLEDTVFPSDAKLFRGCVKLTRVDREVIC